MSTSIPREVNGLWHPVPCPPDFPIHLGFTSREACEAALALDAMEESQRDHEEQVEMRLEGAHESGYDVGYDSGYEEGYQDGYSNAAKDAKETAQKPA